MNPQQKLLSLLADGEVHSGSGLAASLGVSRTAVWKTIGQLAELGLKINALGGRGYQLDAPLQLLDADAIAAGMSPAALGLCRAPLVLWSSESTSDYLLELGAPSAGEAHVCFAEYQSAGRGRRGRQWLAPAGHGICLSVGWTFATSPAHLSCLGLAAGVAVLRALARGGVTAAMLKWPNDVVLNDGKLAGILIDVRGEAGGPLHIVAGVGLNYRLAPSVRAGVQQTGGLEPADLSGACAPDGMPRNALAAWLADELVLAMRSFALSGFESFAAEWHRADYLNGREISVTGLSGSRSGVAAGITADGRLRLEQGGREELLVSGDISVRPRAREGAR